MSISKLESNVGKGKSHKKRTIIYSAAVMLVVGLAFVSVGVGIMRNSANISADTSDIGTPPTPSTPTTDITPVTPSNPGADGSAANPITPSNPGGSTANPVQPSEPTGQVNETEWAFPSGWSVISGKFLEGSNMTDFSAKGLILYSFNDPIYPNRSWSTFPWGETARSDLKNVAAYSPFGYYVYNPGANIVTVSFGPRTPVVRDGMIIARGWHLMYWPNTAASADEVFSKIKIKYQDGTEISAAEAITSKYHRASIKVYGIVNENVIDPSSAIKELTGTDSDTTISSVPPRGYFWLYLRRTRDRVVDVTISS